MFLKPPSFWYRKTFSIFPFILLPFKIIYQTTTLLRSFFIQPQSLPRPVICVGNVVMGGAGKTPVTQAIVKLLQKNNLKVTVLTRGYGGTIQTPSQVHIDQHTPKDVGDEPLLLAMDTSVWIGKDRFQTAQKAIEHDPSISCFIFDDGLQNPSYHKDLSLLVIDGLQGIGNGHVFPCGPLREPLKKALKKVDAVVVIGNLNHLSIPFQGPIFGAHWHYAHLPFAHEKIVAFAGIGFPLKFKNALLNLRYDVVDFVSFPDHYPYKEDDIRHLQEKGLPLITTEKDWIRLPSSIKPYVSCLHGELRFNDPDTVNDFLLNNLPK